MGSTPGTYVIKILRTYTNSCNKLECLFLASFTSILKAPALPANIIISWKGLQGTNTLAYYENS
jgi:hypothetical protein